MMFKVLFPAGISGSSALVSFFASTLPVIQWLAAFVAIVSGGVGIFWVIVQFLRRNRDKR